MAINTFVINTAPINGNGSASIPIGTGQGLIISFEQTLRAVGSGLTVSFEQTQILRNSIDASLAISFEQTIRHAYFTNPVISFEQTVVDADVYTFFDRNGWYPIITVDGWRLPDNLIFGDCTYTHAENNSALFDFSIIPPLGVQDIFAYQGKTVTCDIQVANGTYRIFTGIIDIPEVDVMNERITFRCTDNRDEHLMNGDAGPVGNYGIYSDTIFGAAQDNKQDMQNRLSTLTASLDWDGYRNYYLTSWTPKATADYTLTNSDVYRTEPTIRIESRAQIINMVRINFAYNYQRFHHRQVSYVWTPPYASGAADFLQNGYSMASKEMIQTAVDNAGWPLRGKIGFTPILPSGFYRIGNATIAWSTSTVSGSTQKQTDSSGNPILDTQGNPIYEVVAQSVTDMSQIYCFGAAWNATKRWSQNVTEEFSLVVQAPQSYNRYGVVTSDEQYTFTDVDGSSEWENYTAYSPAPNGTLDSNYFINQNIDIASFNVATVTALAKARATIINAHRDSRVTFDKFIWPEIDLRHTVALNTTRIQCKGKVSQISHTFNVGEGEARTNIEIALFRATGSQSESVITAPTRPSDSFVATGGAIALQSHYGVDPTTPAAAYWNGHIGNKWIKVHEAGYIDNRKTTYQESFIVDAPAIEDAVRLTRTLSASQTYNVAIPTNNLIWTTIGK